MAPAEPGQRRPVPFADPRPASSASLSSVSRPVSSCWTVSARASRRPATTDRTASRVQPARSPSRRAGRAGARFATVVQRRQQFVAVDQQQHRVGTDTRRGEPLGERIRRGRRCHARPVAARCVRPSARTGRRRPARWSCRSRPDRGRGGRGRRRSDPVRRQWREEFPHVRRNHQPCSRYPGLDPRDFIAGVKCGRQEGAASRLSPGRRVQRGWPRVRPVGFDQRV